MPSFPGDLTNSLGGGLTLAPAVLTADVGTNPSISIDMVATDGICTMRTIYGVVHADTTGTVQVVESTTGSNGTWTAIAGAVSTFVGTDDATIDTVTFQRTKRYVGATVDLSGATQSAAIAIEIVAQKKYV